MFQKMSNVNLDSFTYYMSFFMSNYNIFGKINVNSIKSMKLFHSKIIDSETIYKVLWKYKKK